MASIKLYLDTRNLRKDNRFPLKIGLTNKQSHTLIPTGINLLADQWDAEKLRIVNHPQKQSLNNYVSKFALEIESELLNLTSSGSLKGLSASGIKKAILSKLKPQDEAEPVGLFEGRFNEYIESKKNRSTRELYITTLKKIESFAGSARLINFEDINQPWLKSFDKFLERTCTTNGRAIHLRNLRAVFNEAIDDEVISCYPFRKFKIKHEKTAKRSISVSELIRLRDYPVEPHQELYRDLFMLIFYLLGINIVDLCFAKKTDLSNGRLEYVRAKTKRHYSILVTPPAQLIIDKYAGKRYLLNVMERYVNHKDFAQRMNRNLKQIGEFEVAKHGKKIRVAEFPNLTTYVARHTWATIAWSLGVSKDTIAAALGHGGNTVTDIYINTDNRMVDEANRLVLDCLEGKNPAE